MLAPSSFLFGFIAVLPLLDIAFCQQVDSDLVFYGQSPPVYPSRMHKASLEYITCLTHTFS